MKEIFLAGALFSEAEREFDKKIVEIAENFGFNVFWAIKDAKGLLKEERFKRTLKALDECDLMVAVLDGADVDSGTAWEVSRAYSRKKLIIGIRTDFRTLAPEGIVNQMIEMSLTKFVKSLDELKKVLQEYKK